MFKITPLHRLMIISKLSELDVSAVLALLEEDQCFKSRNHIFHL